jgi:hypothetical protein
MVTNHTNKLHLNVIFYVADLMACTPSQSQYVRFIVILGLLMAMTVKIMLISLKKMVKQSYRSCMTLLKYSL